MSFDTEYDNETLELLKLITKQVIQHMPHLDYEGTSLEVLRAASKNLTKQKEELFSSAEEIIFAGKHLNSLGFTVGSSGNISVRLSGKTFVITPSGKNKGSLTKDDLIILDLEGNLIASPCMLKPSSETKMHAESYRLRNDIGAVVHAHPPYCTAFASAHITLNSALLPEAVIILGDSIPLVEYGTPSTFEVPEKLKPHLQGNNAFLLANHGALTFGKNLKEAAHRMETLEFLAQVTAICRSIGSEKPLDMIQLKKLKSIFG